MRRKLKRALKDPFFARTFFNALLNKVGHGTTFYGNVAAYRSDSDDGQYAAAVLAAVNDQKVFDYFKRSFVYRTVLEHVSDAQGRRYLDLVRARDEALLADALTSILIEDDLGGPFKFRHEDFDMPLSATTLRYLKVTSDLKGLFGTDLGHVAEIGCGYGGQAYANDRLLNVAKATLFDLPVVNQLIDRYLNSLLMKGCFETVTINQMAPQVYDLVISNYAFSELPAAVQQTYIRKVLATSRRGYLTMNTGYGGPSSQGKLTLEQLKALLPPFEIFEEDPLTSPHNYILVWGHDDYFAKCHLKAKQVEL